jgi:hypothetical protein
MKILGEALRQFDPTSATLIVYERTILSETNATVTAMLLTNLCGFVGQKYSFD